MTRVLLFGRLRDLAGWRDQRFEPSPTSLSALKSLMNSADALLGAALEGPGVQAAVDHVIVRGDVELGDRAEVAFMPPMSGG